MTLMLRHDDIGLKAARVPQVPRAGTQVLGTGVGLYMAVGLVILHLQGVDLLAFLLAIPYSVANFLNLARLLMPVWALPLAAGMVLLVGPVRRRLVQRAVPILSAILMCGAFTMMFGALKNALPSFVPFWADALFSRADLALHLGHAPHDLLRWMAPLNVDNLLTFYLNGWVFFATFFPALLIAFDDNAARRRSFTMLWMLCWVGLGNVLAAAFMSYGPIFSDLFAQGLAGQHGSALALLERSDASTLMAVKHHLWRVYSGETTSLGSGISAFPSVHVGMATVLGLYLARLGADLARSKRLNARLAGPLRALARLVAVIYVATYAVLSVWLGWHYAVDGYASILLIGGLYWLLQSREPQDQALGDRGTGQFPRARP